jgi:hypothetical protein
MPRDFESSDEGKQVMTADGDVVGTIDRVSGNRAHVKPDEGLSRGLRRKLGWSGEAETYELRKNRVATIDDDGIHLEA